MTDHHPSAGQRLATTLRTARTARGWTQQRLAEEADVSIDTVHRLETNRFSPTLATLEKLASGLRVSVPVLCSGIDGPRPTGRGIDGLSEAQRDFVGALARLFAEA